MKIKDGVRFVSPIAAMLHASMVVEGVFNAFNTGHDCTLTGGIEKHNTPSRHCVGGAYDYRTFNLSEENQEKFRARVSSRLGDGFDVVLESDHLHVEYDPKD